MPGCLGLDAMWQLIGFFLIWSGNKGRGRALGSDKVRFTDQVLRTAKKVTYEIDMEYITRKFDYGRGDGKLLIDGKLAYETEDLRVGLSHLKKWASFDATRCGTGMGIVSSLGNNYDDVTASLKQGKSGISFCQEYKDVGMRSHIHGAPKIDIKEKIDRKILRFMGEGAAYNYIAMQEAIDDAKLTKDEISNDRTGLISGSGGPSTINMLLAWDTIRESKLSKRIGPYMVPRTMSSTNSATLAVPFEIRGVNYSISSACSTSAHCIGNAMELIMLNKQDIIFAGGGEELHWTLSCLFDAMPALSSGRNDTPEKLHVPLMPTEMAS